MGVFLLSDHAAFGRFVDDAQAALAGLRDQLSAFRHDPSDHSAVAAIESGVVALHEHAVATAAAITPAETPAEATVEKPAAKAKG